MRQPHVGLFCGRSLPRADIGATYLTRRRWSCWARRAPPNRCAERGAAHGTKVIILGASVAVCRPHMKSGKAGSCTVEARIASAAAKLDDPAGHQARHVDGSRQRSATSMQSCIWNAGQASGPIHHQACSACGARRGPLEVEVKSSRGACCLNPAKRRQADRDAAGRQRKRGAISEMLGKARDAGALDQELRARDKRNELLVPAQYRRSVARPANQGSTQIGLSGLAGPPVR